MCTLSALFLDFSDPSAVNEVFDRTWNVGEIFKILLFLDGVLSSGTREHISRVT